MSRQRLLLVGWDSADWKIMNLSGRLSACLGMHRITAKMRQSLRLFSAGQQIDGSSKYIVGPVDGWNGSGTGYVGLQFTAAGAPAANFGWLALDYVANGADTTLTIDGFAFEDQPGVAIAAGAEVSPVPEPGTWAAAALLAGGAAFARWRKRRDDAA